MLELQDRVNKGAALLDTKEPGWWQHINQEQLDLDSPRHCILGQLHGEYSYGATRLGKDVGCADDHPWCCEHGFNFSKEDFPWPQRKEFDRLTVLWNEAIQKRRRGEAVSLP